MEERGGFPAPVSEGRGIAGIFQSSMAATLVGLEAPETGSSSLEIKPYAMADLTSVRLSVAGRNWVNRNVWH